MEKSWQPATATSPSKASTTTDLVHCLPALAGLVRVMDGCLGRLSPPSVWSAGKFFLTNNNKKKGRQTKRSPFRDGRTGIPGQFSTRQKSTDISLPTFFHIPYFYQTIFHRTNFHQGRTFFYQDISLPGHFSIRIFFEDDLWWCTIT